MKLSTAILKGSKGRQQTTSELRDSSDAVCALGAACYGVGITPRVGQMVSKTLVRHFPWLREITVLNDGDTLSLQELIIEKNDGNRWSLKHIAKWLRKLGL